MKIGDKALPMSSVSTDRKYALCNSVFRETFYAMLRLHPWNFAIKIKTITKIKDKNGKVNSSSNAYILPSDCLRVLGIVSSNAKFRVECRLSNQISVNTVITDAGSEKNAIFIRYISSEVDISEVDSIFREAVICKMAETLAYTISSDRGMVGIMGNFYREALENARITNDMEGPMGTVSSSMLINVRH